MKKALHNFKIWTLYALDNVIIWSLYGLGGLWAIASVYILFVVFNNLGDAMRFTPLDRVLPYLTALALGSAMVAVLLFTLLAIARYAREHSTKGALDSSQLSPERDKLARPAKVNVQDLDTLVSALASATLHAESTIRSLNTAVDNLVQQLRIHSDPLKVTAHMPAAERQDIREKPNEQDTHGRVIEAGTLQRPGPGPYPPP